MKTIAQQLNITEFPFEIKDSSGNIIYFENSDGFWNKKEYDSNGNRIYSEDSYGSWYKYKYDSNGNQIYFENSNGYWTKKEYDSNGNQIYYESSHGEITDNRPKATCNGKVVEIDGKKYKLTEV